MSASRSSAAALQHEIQQQVSASLGTALHLSPSEVYGDLRDDDVNRHLSESALPCTLDDLMTAEVMFRCLGSVSRLSILVFLLSGERTVGELVEETKLSQPLVSQHLRHLRREGMVKLRRCGRHSHYRLADRHIAHIIEDGIIHIQHGPAPKEAEATPAADQ